MTLTLALSYGAREMRPSKIAADVKSGKIQVITNKQYQQPIDRANDSNQRRAN